MTYELVILEDAPVRLETFKLELAHVNYYITENVKDFLRAVEESKDTVRMLIMDHDLGHQPGPKTKHYRRGDHRKFDWDEEGFSGTEAAQMLPPLNVPVLVWSANRAGAARIIANLEQKGTPCRYIPIWQPADISFVLQTIFPPRGGSMSDTPAYMIPSPSWKGDGIVWEQVGLGEWLERSNELRQLDTSWQAAVLQASVVWLSVNPPPRFHGIALAAAQAFMVEWLQEIRPHTTCELLEFLTREHSDG